ncbi:putative cytochrome c oxidase subunit 2 precursor [Tsukamurella pulmonis]|uniref:cytochrome-c oxidase n=1 Tax=Tsukamurella pulmonis TaxID=47312 RepID=A0A1H1G0V3_9ACTN|nr:cytochrome c oxidase subunit II [Tsukamurella pulmonis]KXO87770.1 cytochrome C oxidase subunit II [Tsukamurella pulmonis]KXP13624.1 cytochrome C oxidase subunit II [Tsukamurella pulmonis]SDR06745.1 cytochrome c oxidase subunit 2 [Tsukamurella pulmonis]SUP18102.1 Cytochrome c oxidase subunit 2 precursor [Tsukamurella pulmonis]BDD82054.1 putative cytochrome c oxidase subunit 2 precursor [Tsukamurella pulmonis]
MAPGSNAHGGATSWRKRLVLAAGLVVGMFALAGCDVDEVMRFGWPEGVTPEARDMTELWSWSVVAALIMGVLVWALTFWTITKHRKKADSPDFPRQTAYNVPLELLYTAVPFLIIAVLFYFTVVVQTKVEKIEDNPGVTVDVTAFQWNWRFAYREVTLDGNKIKLERENPYGKQPDIAKLNEEAEKMKEHGHVEAQPERGPNHGRFQEIRDYLKFSTVEVQGSSAEIPVLVLPTDTRVQFDLASADVVHSFYVPQFAFKRDVMPNPVQNHTQNKFQVSSIDRPGAFVGRCAEMCGDYHSMMNFEIRAVTPENFKKYIEARQSGMDNVAALESIGEVGLSTSTFPFDTRRTGRTASGNSTAPVSAEGAN